MAYAVSSLTPVIVYSWSWVVSLRSRPAVYSQPSNVQAISNWSADGSAGPTHETSISSGSVVLSAMVRLWMLPSATWGSSTVTVTSTVSVLLNVSVAVMVTP